MGFKRRQSDYLTSPDVLGGNAASQSLHSAPGPLLCPQIMKSKLLDSIDPLKPSHPVPDDPYQRTAEAASAPPLNCDLLFNLL